MNLTDIRENKNCALMQMAFISAIIVGLITYLTYMVLQPVAADPVLFENWFKPGKYQLITQGRWSSGVYSWIRGYLNIPVISTILTILDMAVSAALFTYVFSVEGKIKAALIGASVAAHPMVANLIMYSSISGNFKFSFVMFAIAIIREKKINCRIAVVTSVVIIAVVLGYDQGVISIFATICVFALIKDLLDGHRAEGLRLLGKEVVIGLMGCALYLAVWKALMSINDITELYVGAENYGLRNSIFHLPQKAVGSYRIFFDYCLRDTLIHNSYWGRGFLNIVLLGSAFIVTVRSAVIKYRTKIINRMDVGLLLFSLLVLPIALTTITFLTTDYIFYLLLAGGYVFVIPFTLVLAGESQDLDSQPKDRMRVFRGIIALSSAIIIWTFILSNNAGFLLLNQTFTQTKSIAIRVLDRIEQLENFTYDSPVCFIGQPSYELSDNLIKASPGSTFLQLGVFTGVWENSDGWGRYIYYYGGEKLNYYSNGMQDRIVEISETDEFKACEIFPAANSVGWIEGVIVVKLGEDNDWKFNAFDIV